MKAFVVGIALLFSGQFASAQLFVNNNGPCYVYVRLAASGPGCVIHDTAICLPPGGSVNIGLPSGANAWCHGSAIWYDGNCSTPCIGSSAIVGLSGNCCGVGQTDTVGAPICISCAAGPLSMDWTLPGVLDIS